MTILAAITSRSGAAGRPEYLVCLYDTQAPRLPNSPRPELRYACVNMLGPFRSLEAAESVAAVYPASDA